MKCIASFAVGDALKYQKYTIGNLKRFADLHNYDLCVPTTVELNPPSWGKIPLLISLLQTYDKVLWVDADIYIMDISEDIVFPINYSTAMVRHYIDKQHTHDTKVEEDGKCWVPNCGVWYLRKSALSLLNSIRSLYSKYRTHCWWEQAALIELLDAIEAPYWLDVSWNRHVLDNQTSDKFRFLHATAIDDRVRLLRTLSSYDQSGIF